MAETLTALLEETAAALPDAPALAFLDEPALTYRDFAAAARRVAAGLARQGIGAGDRVAIWLPNRPEYLILHFALARLGAAAIHVNTRFRAQEVAYLLERARPCAIVTQWGFAAGDFPALLEELLPRLGAPLSLVIGLDTAETRLGALPVLPWSALDAMPERETDDATPERDCLTFTTSGTTSGPKLVLHRQRSIARHASDVAARLGFDAPRRGGSAMFLASIPLCGTFGLAAAMGAIAGGACILCQDRFDPAVADRLIRGRGVTHLIGGDDMIYRLAEAAGDRPYHSVRFTGFASFHPGAERVIGIGQRLNLHARGLYGSSELQALFTIQDEEDAERRCRGGGIAVSAQAEIRARDAEGQLAERGEIECRAPSMFVGYLNDPAATAKALTADGFYRTGDLGRMHPRGGFDFESRLGDALRLGGFLVNPEEIEAFLKAQPGVANAQVVGIRGASMAVAFVIPQPGAAVTEAQLAEACRARLARYKLPARIIPVERFPVTQSANGEKIQRVKLREMAEELMAETAR